MPMVNRLADRILNVVLPHEKAAAPCAYYNKYCFCSRGLQYYKRCRECTGGGSGCGSCTIIGGAC